MVQINAAGDPFDYTDVIGFGLGGASGVVQWPQDEYDGIWKNLPIAVTGIAGVPGIAVEPMPSPAALANPLPAPALFSVNPAVAPTPAIRDTLSVSAAGLLGQLTMRAKMKFLADLGENIFCITATNLQVIRRGTGTSKSRLIWTLKDGAGATMFSSRSNAALYNLALNQLADIVISIDLPGRVARMWVDGVQIDNVALPANSGRFNTSRFLEFLGDGSIPTAQVELLEVWHAYTATGDTAALGTPRKRITAAPAGLPVETPATPAWVRGPLA